MTDRRPEETTLVSQLEAAGYELGKDFSVERDATLHVHYRLEGGLPKQIKQRAASPADIIAAVRAGVESGTIKGEVVRVVFDSYAGYGFVGRDGRMVDLDDGTHIVIGPVSDGGSET